MILSNSDWKRSLLVSGQKEVYLDDFKNKYDRGLFTKQRKYWPTAFLTVALFLGEIGLLGDDLIERLTTGATRMGYIGGLSDIACGLDWLQGLETENQKNNFLLNQIWEDR